MKKTTLNLLVIGILSLAAGLISWLSVGFNSNFYFGIFIGLTLIGASWLHQKDKLR